MMMMTCQGFHLYFLGFLLTESWEITFSQSMKNTCTDDIMMLF